MTLWQSLSEIQTSDLPKVTALTLEVSEVKSMGWVQDVRPWRTENLVAQRWYCNGIYAIIGILQIEDLNIFDLFSLQN